MKGVISYFNSDLFNSDLFNSDLVKILLRIHEAVEEALFQVPTVVKDQEEEDGV